MRDRMTDKWGRCDACQITHLSCASLRRGLGTPCCPRCTHDKEERRQ